MNAFASSGLDKLEMTKKKILKLNTMDRILEKKKGINLIFTKKAVPFWLGAVLVAFIVWLVARDDSKKLRVNLDNISVNAVISGQFNDYIRIRWHR